MNKKILLVSCIGEISDTHTIKYINTLMSNNFVVESVRVGVSKDSSFQHFQLPNITINFWPSGLSVFAFVSALLQRARNFFLAGRVILFKSKPQIIVATEPDSWLLACLCKFFLRAKVVADIREVYEDRVMGFPASIQKPSLWLLKKLMRALSYYSDEIIHVSKERQRVYSYLDKMGKVIVYYPDLDRSPLNTNHNISSEFTIVHAGALRDKYGASEILMALKEIADQELSIKLIVLGGTAGPIKQLALIDYLIGKRVLKIVPPVSYDLVLNYLERSSIGLNIVLPVDQSHYLAQPRKLYEYLSKGLPFVAADVPTIREVVLKWECGKLVDPYDSKALANTIISIFKDKQWLERASSNALHAHQNEYNWELEKPKFIRIFQILLNESLDY